MSERRSLTAGLKATPPPINVAPEMKVAMEKKFVFGESEPAQASATNGAAMPSRVPISTRIRADYAAALKRASLERQLESVEPNTLQDILEQAIEPWLRSNGYLP